MGIEKIDSNYKLQLLACQYQKQSPGGILEKGALKNFAKITEKYLCQSLFLIKLMASGLQLYWKRYSGTDVFLWILRNI